jgi:dephospho-CoA kinase
VSGVGRALRIGLTGPIGCGKSTVASWLHEEGAVIVDADRVARDVVEPGEPALDAVFEAFGPDVRRADGSLDRQALGRIVFSDAEALARLEAITHPAVRPRIFAAIERADSVGAVAVIIEAIKLVEGGLAVLCDEVWLVRCDPDDQRARLRGNGRQEADAEARIAAQGDLESRLRGAATRVIDTSGAPVETRVRVLEAWRSAFARIERAAPDGAARIRDEA